METQGSSYQADASALDTAGTVEAADTQQPEKVVSLDDRQRKARVADALRTGARLPSTDMRDGEYFARTHRALLSVLATARQLTSNEFQYIFALLAHTNGKYPWAIAEFPDKLPRLNDWAAWLGGMTTQQVYNIRASLHERGIITYVDGNPAKVALVQEWESWEPSSFAPHTPRKGAGRKAKSKSGNLDSNVHQEMYITEFSSTKLPNLESVIRQFSGDASEAAISQVPDTPLKKGKKIEEDTTDANASAERDSAPASPEKSSRSRQKQPKHETPEEKERRIAEAVYVTDLCKRQLAALKCTKSPRGGEDRAGGHWFYSAGPAGAPADPEQVLALLRVVKQSPHYSGKYLTLQAIRAYWPDWQQDPERVRESIAVEQRKADYARAAASQNNTRSRSTPASAGTIAGAGAGSTSAQHKQRAYAAAARMGVPVPTRGDQHGAK